MNDVDLGRRLRGIAPAALRRGMVAKLRQPHLFDADAELAGAVLLRIGPGEAVGDLLDVLADPAADHAPRMAALRVLSTAAAEAFERRLKQLEPDRVREILLLPYVDLLADSKAGPGLAQVVTKTLLDAAPEMRRLVLDSIGRARRKVGVGAVDAYRDALAVPEIRDDATLREPILLGLVEEADADAMALLEDLRSMAPDEIKAAFQAALLRIGTARAEGGGPTPPVGVQAWAGTPDGQGAVVVLVDVPNPDGSRTAVDLCLRLDQDVRGGFVLPRATPDHVAQLRRELEQGTGCAFTEVPVGQVVRLVDDAVARTAALGRDLPADVSPALGLLARIPREDLAPLPSPVAPVGIGQVRAILDRPGFGAWFLDEGDLAGSGVGPPPRRRHGLDRWLRDALATLASGPVAARIAVMAEYMARWAVWSGNSGEAGSWSTLAAELRTDFGRSPLARAMVERFLAPVGSSSRSDSRDERFLEGPRRKLQRDFFADIKEPRGIDVARLDFAEAVRAAFHLAVGSLVGHDRPRDDDLDALAVDLAKILVDHVIECTTARRNPGGSKLDSAVERTVTARGSVPVAARGVLAASAIAGAAALFEGTCATCPVRCLSRPGEPMAEVFFADPRPADRPRRRRRAR